MVRSSIPWELRTFKRRSSTELETEPRLYQIDNSHGHRLVSACQLQCTGALKSGHVLQFLTFLKWPGWGLRDLTLFSKALRMKSAWRGLFCRNPWNKILVDKYLKGQCVYDWIQKDVFNASNASVVWNGILDVIAIIKPGLSWRIGDGTKIRIGMDRIVGVGEDYLLSDSLINTLHEKGYYTLNHIYLSNGQSGSLWINASTLRLAGVHILEWSHYLNVLKRMGISLSHRDDTLVWIHNKSTGCITVKLAYDHFSNPSDNQGRWWGRSIWNCRAPLKIICLIWLTLHDRILTWSNLIKRGWQGPGVCPFCSSKEESTFHIFVQCVFARDIWNHVCSVFGLKGLTFYDTLEGFFCHWFKHMINHRALFLFVIWHILLCRNSKVFKGSPPHAFMTGWKAIHHFNEFDKQQVVKANIVRDPFSLTDFPAGFFDGAAQGASGGCGFVLYLRSCHKYQGWLHLDHCTNNFSEMVAVWSLLYWANRKNIKVVRIFGDSRLVIDWLNGKSSISNILLEHWCQRIRELTALFEVIQFQHIYRSYNEEADRFSKMGLRGQTGILHIKEMKEDKLMMEDSIILF